MTRNPERIVDEQVRTWAYQQSVIYQKGEPQRFWPIITISREFGSGGAALARLLSRRIGFTVWDKELVEAIADATGGDRTIVESLDEHRRRAIDEAVHALVIGPRHTNVKYLRTLVRVVRAAAARGGSIIVGRGAQYLCPPETRLSVRIVAPFDLRVRVYAEREGIDAREARRIVRSLEADQKDFVQTCFHRDIDEATDYHLVLNRETFPLEGLAELVLEAYRVRFGERPPEMPREGAGAVQRTGARAGKIRTPRVRL